MLRAPDMVATQPSKQLARANHNRRPENRCVLSLDTIVTRADRAQSRPFSVMKLRIKWIAKAVKRALRMLRRRQLNKMNARCTPYLPSTYGTVNHTRQDGFPVRCTKQIASGGYNDVLPAPRTLRNGRVKPHCMSSSRFARFHASAESENRRNTCRLYRADRLRPYALREAHVGTMSFLMLLRRACV